MGERVLLRVYEMDDGQMLFENELSKLNLLNEIMEDLGVQDQSFIAKVIDSFACPINDQVTVLCIIMEHLE